MITQPYTTSFQVLEMDMSTATKDDNRLQRPADRPLFQGIPLPPDLQIVESPVYSIPSEDDRLSLLLDLVGLTRDRIPSMSPAELESFRARALPHLRELERLLTSGSPSA